MFGQQMGRCDLLDMFQDFCWKLEDMHALDARSKWGKCCGKDCQTSDWKLHKTTSYCMSSRSLERGSNASMCGHFSHFEVYFRVVATQNA